MTWHLARQSDCPAIERFLYRYVQHSMFPLANLRDYGLSAAHPRSLTVWVLGSDMQAVICITNDGMIFLQCPACTDADFAAVLKRMSGRAVRGLAGEAAQSRQFLRAAGWQDVPANLDSDEPAFSLDLGAMVLPDLAGAVLAPLARAGRALVTEWRRLYHIEALGTAPDQAEKQAAGDIETYLERDSHRVLLVGGKPVAMTGFNARLPDVVQIGGVFTPPDLRGHGHARRAVALHLLEARQQGVSRAVLCAGSNAAARAYRALGFVRAGLFSLILFRDATEVTP